MSIQIFNSNGKPMRMNRRNFLRVTAGLGGAAFLSACAAPAAAPAPGAPSGESQAPSGESQAPSTSGDQVALNVLWENWGDIYNNLMTEIGTDFNKTTPNVNVEWNFDPDWVTKLTTLIAANNVPDATLMRPAPLANLAPKGALLELDAYLKDAGVSRDDFIAPMYDSGLHDGKQYAIPGGADFICMFYSKDVYEAAGLDPEKPAITTEELLGHTKQMMQKDSAGDIQRAGYIPTAGSFVNWAYIHGGKFYDADSGKITANDPANIAAMEYLKEFVKLYDINKMAAFNARPGMFEAGNPFSTKQLGFVMDGFWFYEALDQHAPDLNYGVSWWPTLNDSDEDRKRYAMSGWMVSLPKGAPHTEEAWNFLKYGFIDNSARMGYLTLNGPCILKAAGDWEAGLKEKMGANNRMVPYLEFFSKTGALATNFFPVIPVQAFYQDELNRVFDLVMRDEVTPQAGLDEVTKNVQAELDKAMKPA
ncbi:MAG: extracellular solute-binding protein [Anaerolineae bacterium]|nr:extracellular solute-binding protein [Anaerolineae bacterium]